MSYDTLFNFATPPEFDATAWPGLRVGPSATPAGVLYIPEELLPFPNAADPYDAQVVYGQYANMNAPEFDASFLLPTTTQPSPSTTLGKHKERDASSDAFYGALSGERVESAFTCDADIAAGQEIAFFNQGATQAPPMCGEASMDPTLSGMQLPGVSYDQTLLAMLAGGLDAPPQQSTPTYTALLYDTSNDATIGQTPLSFEEQSTPAEPSASALGKRKERDASSVAFFDALSSERAKRPFTREQGTAIGQGMSLDELATQAAMMYGEAPMDTTPCEMQVPYYDEKVLAMLAGELDAPPQQSTPTYTALLYDTSDDATIGQTPLSFGEQSQILVAPEDVSGEWPAAQPGPESFGVDYNAGNLAEDDYMLRLRALVQDMAADGVFDTAAPVEDVIDMASMATLLPDHTQIASSPPLPAPLYNFVDTATTPAQLPEQTQIVLPAPLTQAETGLASTSAIPLPFGPRRHARKPSEQTQGVPMQTEHSKSVHKQTEKTRGTPKKTGKTKAVGKKATEPRRSVRLAKAAAAGVRATRAAKSIPTAEASGSPTRVSPAPAAVAPPAPAAVAPPAPAAAASPAPAAVVSPSTVVVPAVDADVTEHENAHNGKKGHSCCIDDCQYVSYDCTGTRDRHMVTHFGNLGNFNQRYIKCPYCGVGFARLSSRKRHLTEAKDSECVEKAIKNELNIKNFNKEMRVPKPWELKEHIHRVRQPAKDDPLFKKVNGLRGRFGLPTWE